ncbi:hypothetical protein VE25_21015 [Devosia geojensis]|uniref:Uncharacterized protein n=1 Tax=Devosia geojensis TaxID=443610 RepID=A0A0F5FDY4_9HYPH|nr:putative glycolipid-binding domain-containing protein [Devosia geojensis]KKB06790.1 hypothetical protein VE25_21015 [Devosia geojensis]
MLSRSIRWRTLDGDGLEHLLITEEADGIFARGVIVSENERRFAASYTVSLSLDWLFREVDIETVEGTRLNLTRDPLGNWTADGIALPELGGCVDIDMSASAFTNSLPIRRVGMQVNEPQRFDMAWIPLDTLKPFPDGQIYTALGEGTYRYQSEASGFEGRITVDSDGLILKYDPLFERV